MRRRDFLGMAAASVFVPQFGRWYRQVSGLILPEWELTVPHAGWMGHGTALFVNDKVIRPRLVVDHNIPCDRAYLRAPHLLHNFNVRVGFNEPPPLQQFTLYVK